MMDVQVMRAVVDVLESDALPDVASKAVARWDGADLRYVRSSANHVFRFRRAGETCFLRLTPASERSREAIEAELAFVEHVAGRTGRAPAHVAHWLSHRGGSGRWWALLRRGVRRIAGRAIRGRRDGRGHVSRVGSDVSAHPQRLAELPSTRGAFGLARADAGGARSFAI
jgi:hypothetical protein